MSKASSIARGTARTAGGTSPRRPITYAISADIDASRSVSPSRPWSGVSISLEPSACWNSDGRAVRNGLTRGAWGAIRALTPFFTKATNTELVRNYSQWYDLLYETIYF